MFTCSRRSDLGEAQRESVVEALQLFPSPSMRSFIAPEYLSRSPHLAQESHTIRSVTFFNETQDLGPLVNMIGMSFKSSASSY